MGMGRIIFFPYKIGSKSCGDLVSALKARNAKVLRVFPDRRYRRRVNDLIINWGNSQCPNWQYDGMLNKPEAVYIAVNKLRTFNRLIESGVYCVPFTEDRQKALSWGSKVVARIELEGHSGEGAVICEGDEIPEAPLYTMFVPRSREYRVHVFKGEVIDYAKKVKRVDGRIVSRTEDEMDRIRSHVNGWEYLRDVEPRESVKELAIEAIKALGLDFGAVDIIRDHEGNNYVLEVGTAAGLSPVGVKAYVSAILKLCTI